MQKIFILIVLMLLPKITLATDFDLTQFHERFEIKTNEANEKIIVSKTLLDKVSIETYVRNLASFLMEAEMSAPFALPTCQGVAYEKPDPKAMESFEKAFDWLKKTNVGKLLTEEKFLKFLGELAKLSDEYTKDPDYIIMANLDNPTYFYKKQFGKFLGNQLKKLIKNQLELASYVKLITFVADDYTRHVLNKKTYHQNILAFYLESVPSDQLGLTEQEKNRALSSIADSRLSFGFSGMSKSKKIKNNFDSYGYDLWAKSSVDAEKRWNKHQGLFDSRLEKQTSVFSVVSHGQSPIVVNLGVKKDKSSDKPSYVYDKECPDFVYEMRKNYEFIRIALGMSPIPYSSRLFTVFKSKYQPQAMSEGSYAGYLEATGDAETKAVIQKQSMNPLL